MVDPVLSSKAKGLAASSTLLTVTVLFAGITGIGSEGTTLGVWLERYGSWKRSMGCSPALIFTKVDLVMKFKYKSRLDSNVQEGISECLPILATQQWERVLWITSSFLLLFLRIYLSIYLQWKTDLQREWKTERDPPLILHSLNGCNGQSWAILKPRIRNFFQISHVGGGVQGLGLPLLLSQSIWQDLNLKWSSQNTNECLHGILSAQYQLAVPSCWS